MKWFHLPRQDKESLLLGKISKNFNSYADQADNAGRMALENCKNIEWQPVVSM